MRAGETVKAKSKKAKSIQGFRFDGFVYLME